jgi:hypothetical protein
MAKIKEQVINKNLTVVGDLTVVGEINRGEMTNADSVAKASAYSVKQRPKFGDVLNGFVTGGTTVPTVPAIQKATGVFQGIVLFWDQQLNLSNFAYYEVQVSDDDANWYSLQQDGSDWKDTIAAVTRCSAEMLVHAGITIATALYYRVRRVTTAPATSAWSASVSATASQTASAGLAVNSFYANVITAALLNAIIANVSGALLLGTTYSAGATPVEGDRRIYADNDELGFQVYTNGAWATARSIKLGGVDTDGNFLPFLSCRGLLGDMSVCPTGDPVPDASFYRFNFDNAITYSAVTKWEGTHALAPTDNALNMNWTDAWVVGDSVTACFMFRDDSETPYEHDLLSWGVPGADDCIRINYLETRKVNIVINKDATATTVESGVALTQNVWHFIGVTYVASENKLYWRVDDADQDIVTPSGTWGAAVAKLFFLICGGNGGVGFNFQNLMDDMIISHTSSISADLFYQHVQRGLPWDSSTTALDVIVKAQAGGKIRLLSATSISDLVSYANNAAAVAAGLAIGDLYRLGDTVGVVH